MDARLAALVVSSLRVASTVKSDIRVEGLVLSYPKTHSQAKASINTTLFLNTLLCE
jgi:hypothetical protein